MSRATLAAVASGHWLDAALDASRLKLREDSGALRNSFEKAKALKLNPQANAITGARAKRTMFTVPPR